MKEKIKGVLAMWESILNASVGLQIIWGIGLIGILLFIISNTYMNGLIHGSENMATTKKKSLRLMRQKYENGRSLGINNGDSQAYVEKSIRKLRLMAAPLEMWRHTGVILCYITGMVVAAGFLYYDVSWRGSPEMKIFIANSFLVMAFLMVLDNIFSINNKIEILKANIRDYFDNITFGRELKSYERNRNMKEIAAGQVENIYRGKQKAKYDASEEDASEPMLSKINKTESKEISDESLNGFLKEFFS